MVYFLWFRGFVPHSVVETDSLLLQTMIHIRNQNYDQTRHTPIHHSRVLNEITIPLVMTPNGPSNKP
jgi:hypothetical protein